MLQKSGVKGVPKVEMKGGKVDPEQMQKLQGMLKGSGGMEGLMKKMKAMGGKGGAPGLAGLMGGGKDGAKIGDYGVIIYKILHPFRAKSETDVIADLTAKFTRGPVGGNYQEQP